MSLREDGGVCKFVEIWQESGTYLRAIKDVGRHVRTPKINGFVSASKRHTNA